jgi:sulfite reductase (NADPH) flavoprotein alpha-component
VCASVQDPKKKRYVTDCLKEQALVMWGLLADHNAFVYVCGGTQMGRDVSAALEGMAVAQGQMTDAQAKKWMADLSSAGRLQMELWS